MKSSGCSRVVQMVLLIVLTILVFDMMPSRGKGGQVTTAISRNDALVLWDTVSSSIRLRPLVQAHTIRLEKSAVQEGE